MDTQFSKDGIRIKRYRKENREGEVVYVETPEWRDYAKQVKFEKNFSLSCIPSHVMDISFDDYVGDKEKIEKLKIYINKFNEKFKKVHLYFWSEKNSTQKTTISSLVGKELLKKGFSVHFILMGQLLKILSQEQYETDEEILNIIKKVKSCDFLIIDDAFDIRKATVYKSGYQIPFLDEFLRRRLEIEKKATCFTSNVSVGEIDENVFGVSLKHLMVRSILDPFYFETKYSMINDFNPDDLWK